MTFSKVTNRPQAACSRQVGSKNDLPTLDKFAAMVVIEVSEEHDVDEELTIARRASHARAVMGPAIPDLPTLRTAQFWQTVLDLASAGVTGAAIALHITCLADNRALPTTTTAQPTTQADTTTRVADPHRARDAGAELNATQAPAAPAAAPHNHGSEPGNDAAAAAERRGHDHPRSARQSVGAPAALDYAGRRHRRSVRVAEWFNCLATEEQKVPVVTVRPGSSFVHWVVRVDHASAAGTAAGTAPTCKDAKKIALVRHFIDPAFDPDRAGSPSPHDMRWPAALGRRRALEAARKKERNAAMWARAGEPPPGGVAPSRSVAVAALEPAAAAAAQLEDGGGGGGAVGDERVQPAPAASRAASAS